MTVYLEKSITATSFTKEMQALLAPRKNIALHIVRAEGVRASNGRAWLYN